MPVFAYEARTEDGELKSGMVTAPDLATAGQKLCDQNYYIIKLGAADGPSSDEPRTREGTSRLKGSKKSVMWFMNQMAIMIETGITLSSGLEILAKQATEPAMKEILTDISAAVHEGRPLSDAMEAYPRTFPTVSVAMIRASESSGTFAVVLNRVADYMLKDSQALGRLRGALVYPAFMFLMCISVTVFLLTVILPRFAAIYASKGALLPGPTRILMFMCDAILKHGFYLTGTIGAVTGVLIWYCKTVRGREVKDRFQLSIPLFGKLMGQMFQSRTFRAVGTLLDAGVPISHTLQLAKAMSSNTLYRRLWTNAEEGVSNGERITLPLAASGLLPESVIQMIDCGDRSGRLGFVFNRLADFTEQEYDRTVKTVGTIIEPLMMLVMGSIVGFVAIAMLLPMFKVASVVAH
jgi:type IV pilus assembly protein PilC